ncbi:MAG: hypothetical protein HQK56_17850, partial [Deltaproteobacteria bacterium]|nr:hypothetical protein [Deltaproteobacteria bacterium]
VLKITVEVEEDDLTHQQLVARRKESFAEGQRLAEKYGWMTTAELIKAYKDDRK